MKFNTYLTAEKEYPLAIYARKAAEMKAAGIDVVNLTIGDPRDDSATGVYDSLKHFAERTTNSSYPAGKGSNAYRQAVANWIKRNHRTDFDPNTEILSCNGTKEAVFHLAMLFDWSEEQEIFIPSLSYPVYQSSAEILKVPYRVLPLSEENNFLPDLDIITEEQWQKCTMFWINSPHNPTTTIAPKAYFEKLIALAEKYDFLVCSDECYNDICFVDETPISALDFPESKNWLVLRSLSKRSHMTGFRIGALISKNQDLISRLQRLRAPIGVGSPDFVQEAAITAWNDDQHPLDFTEVYREKRNLLKNALEKKGFHVFSAQAGFYLWFRHDKLKKSEDILSLFINAGIVITPGTAFGTDGEGYARMVFCDKLERIQEAVSRIEKFEL